MPGLDDMTAVRGDLVSVHSSGKLECVACAHRCKLAAGKRGVCKIRFRDDEGLRVPWGYTAGAAVDPIEKKPFFHVAPGSAALSFGMLGCDMHCAYCQNWLTSQALRDESALPRTVETTPEELVEAAVQHRCRSVISTYNEPLISAEWAQRVFTLAKARGLLTGFVSNGHATPEVLDYLGPVTDLYKVDLKSFREAAYRNLGGRLRAVTETIEGLVNRGYWVEVVTLVVPGFNDDDGELREMAAFLAAVSPSIPWHVTAFHPDYRMTDRSRTPVGTLAKAREIGRGAGLEFVYSGNVPAGVVRGEATLCPRCRALVIDRVGFTVTQNRLLDGGVCPECGNTIPGVW